MQQQLTKYQFKFLLIGDSGVGKTSLLIRYCNETFRQQYFSTIGVDYSSKQIIFNNNVVNLKIWDSAGQQRFRNITKSFYKGAQGILVVYSINDRKSFEHIEHWIQQIKQSGNTNASMILIATKLDLEQFRQVKKVQGQQLAEKFGIRFIETSSKQNYYVSEAFDQLTEQVLENDKKQNNRLKRNSNKALIKINSKNIKKSRCC